LLQGVLDAFRVAEDVPLESKQVTDAIDKIQARVEEYYAGIREQVFVFDDVLSMQRNALYKRRAALLQADDASLVSLLDDYCAATLRDVVPAHLAAAKAGKEAAKEAGSSFVAADDGAADWARLADKVVAFFPGLAPLPPSDLAAAFAAGGEFALVAALQGAVKEAAGAKRAQLEASSASGGSRQGRFAKIFQYLALVQVTLRKEEKRQTTKQTRGRGSKGDEQERELEICWKGLGFEDGVGIRCVSGRVKAAVQNARSIICYFPVAVDVACVRCMPTNRKRVLLLSLFVCFSPLSLYQLDNGWSEHLRGMGYLKEAVVMRKYLGRDPLQEYVTEAKPLFQSFLDASRRNTAYSLFAYQVPPAK
jgi:hypothetical protein